MFYYPAPSKLPSLRSKPKCKRCKFYVFTPTLGSPDVPVWHCRSGFTPHFWVDFEPPIFSPCYELAFSNYVSSHKLCLDVSLFKF